MSRSRIIVAEDEQDVRDLILLHLKRDGYEVTAAEDGEAAARLLADRKFDLAVLDWMLPGISGLDLARQLRGGVPVLMVTARADTADIVLGLEAGADDYITKPFEIPVLLARVRALLRRGAQGAGSAGTEVRVGGLVLNTESYQVHCAGEEIHLTISEFRLLAALMTQRGRVLSRERLMELVQGQGVVVTDRAIDTLVFGLRKKLGPCADVVETIRGVGYRVQIG